MIIDEKLKYIFIGLPYSGSSAISKELIENYNGKTLFHKHANIPLLLKIRPHININDYLIFAVRRDPIDITISMYNKFLTNANDMYTDPKHFIENGGFVSKKERNTYLKIHKYNWSFENFIKHTYRFKHYNNDLSINNKYINYIIKFEEMSNDFDKCLKKIGLKPMRVLPVYNITKKVSTNSILTPKIETKVFSPFYKFNENIFNKPNIQLSFFTKITFMTAQYFRKIKRMRYDLRRSSNLQSYDFK